MPAYLRPTTTDAALAALGAAPLGVLAGGTDFFPARVGRALADDVLDITAIPELAAIVDAGTHWRVGATATWRAVRDAHFGAGMQALQEAAREVGGEQVQNTGTVAGNLCNASPAADGVPPLLALGASIELASRAGVRELPLGQFLLGARRTARRPDELVVAIRVPKPTGARAASTFLKLGSRRYLVISFVMVAVAIEVDGAGRISSARVAAGACSPVACRLPALEQALYGQPVGPNLAALPAPAHLAPLSPISDVRADAGYRREAALVLVRRALAEVADRLADDGAARPGPGSAR